MATIAPSRRVRRTPFSDGVEAAGVKGYTVYNRMLLPTVFRSVEEDYHHLKSAVQVWDVSVERQVELRGPDAGRLMQMLTPRDLRGMLPGMCYYVPLVDGTGGMLNDPVALMLAEDRYWLSIADSDLLLWVKGLAHALYLDVIVEEPDVSPLAIQGPKSDELAARIFGDNVKDLRFFRYGYFDFEGHQFLVARSGYSKQGGFEIYVDGHERGMPLWNALMDAGRDLDVHAGCPNLIERVTAPGSKTGKVIGQVTSAAKSPDFDTNVAIGMVKMTHWDEGTEVQVETQDGPRRAIVHENFWI